ncbi:sensor histidine kinase [Dyadobacter subterraneus]|uniref:histidine kinase n=1 Tax=Dyadobacter subterraneus TaxID=2773304 RepID=A0ABR9WHV7_9BACT|nr:ATP-binding protein [Dyadobacter subterraneus]MBE9463744.1 sensor histidine kinase [Dyadobacter subterraneus]
MFSNEIELFLTLSVATIILVLFVAFLIAFAQIFRQRQLRFQQEKIAIENNLKAQYDQEILKTHIEIQNLTLQEIAQNLHDNIGQLLSVAKLNLNILEDLELSEESRQYIKQTNEIIGLSIKDVRNLTRSFDGDFVKDFGLEESLSHELKRLRDTNAYSTELSVSGARYSLGFEREIVLFRVAQEILNNALKHASANRIIAQLIYKENEFVMRIGDNGIGFDIDLTPKTTVLSSGAGLRNISRRTKLIGGKLDLETGIGRGTTIEISVIIKNHS